MGLSDSEGASGAKPKASSKPDIELRPNLDIPKLNVPVPNASSIINDRRYVRANITRIYNIVMENGFQYTNDDKKLEYFERLLELRSGIREMNSFIHQNTQVSEEDLENVIEEEESYEEKLVTALRITKPADGTPRQLNIVSYDDNSSRKLRLPNVSLPVYSNDKNESLERFFHSFESIINQHRLSDYERFVYLKGQLRGPPLTIVDSLDSLQQSYVSAKLLLEDAFASPLTQKYEVIKRLSELNLGYDDDVYAYISSMRSIVTSFESLKIDIETVIQYFAWQGMNSRFQGHIIQITNESKPSLDEINRSVFNAAERYLKMNEQYKERKSKGNNRNNFNKTENAIMTGRILKLMRMSWLQKLMISQPTFVSCV